MSVGIVSTEEDNSGQGNGSLSRRSLLALALGSSVGLNGCMTIEPNFSVPEIDETLESRLSQTHQKIDLVKAFSSHSFPNYIENFFYVLKQINKYADDSKMHNYFVSGKELALFLKEFRLETYMQLEHIYAITRTDNKLSLVNDSFTSYVPKTDGHIAVDMPKDMEFIIEYSDKDEKGEDVLMLRINEDTSAGKNSRLEVKCSGTAKLFGAKDMGINWLTIYDDKVYVHDVKEASMRHMFYDNGKTIPNKPDVLYVKPYSSQQIAEVERYFKDVAEFAHKKPVKPYFIFTLYTYEGMVAELSICDQSVSSFKGKFRIIVPNENTLSGMNKMVSDVQRINTARNINK